MDFAGAYRPGNQWFLSSSAREVLLAADRRFRFPIPVGAEADRVRDTVRDGPASLDPATRTWRRIGCESAPTLLVAPHRPRGGELSWPDYFCASAPVWEY